jgi:hypothetical protein
MNRREWARRCIKSAERKIDLEISNSKGDVMLYRINTENINITGIMEITGRHFTGYTMLFGKGVWEGTLEPCVIIEIMADKVLRPEVVRVCEEIKEFNHQQAVLLEEIECKAVFV